MHPCDIVVIMKKKVERISIKYNCILIYLFGSQADMGRRYLLGEKVGQERYSDLDIAVCFEKLPEKTIDVYEGIFVEFSKLFEPFNVDIVFIHEVDILFRYEIIKGVRIYEKSEYLADRFEEEVMRMAEDIYFKKHEFDREVMEAIEDGYFQFEYSPNP